MKEKKSNYRIIALSFILFLYSIPLFLSHFPMYLFDSKSMISMISMRKTRSKALYNNDLSNITLLS